MMVFQPDKAQTGLPNILNIEVGENKFSSTKKDADQLRCFIFKV